MESECRTCLKVSVNMHDVFSNDLPHKIETISSVEIAADDRYPSHICEDCVKNVIQMYQFYQVIRTSNTILTRRFIKEEAEITEFKEETIHEEFEIKDENDDLTDRESLATCKICSKVCKHKEALRSHMMTHDNDPYLCTICGKVYQHRQGYNVHRKRHANGDAKTVECSTCGKLFFDKKTLVRHIYIHTGERPYSCKFCNRGFTSSYTRNIHVRLHTKEKPYACDLCDATFTQRVSLKTHMNSKHSDKVIVNKEITKFSSGGDSKSVKCDICGKVFKSKQMLPKHMRSHTGERPYLCEYCNKGFSSGSALKTHTRQHTNEKPFACEYCEMAFPQRVSLKTHLKSKHPDNT